jgi:dolichyl-phosphate beta-glucosyltransferase
MGGGVPGERSAAAPGAPAVFFAAGVGLAARPGIMGALTLSIVIPAFNEERRLPSTLDTLLAWLATGDWRDAEVLIVDDGSRDGTARLVEERSAADARIRLVRNPGNRGKGYAVRHGMLEARGEWVLMSDADLSAPITELPPLFRAVAAGNAAIAIGSRALDRSLIGVHQTRARELSGIFFNLVMRLITGLPYADTQCGFKLYRRDAAREIFSRQLLDGFGFDVEDLVIAKVLGIAAVEVPVRWNNVEGTKVSLLEGLRSFAELAEIRWNALRGRYARVSHQGCAPHKG